MATAAKKAGISPAERKKKADKYLGTYRFIRHDPDGGNQIFPEYMGTPYWCPDGMTREICTDISAEGKPVWTICPDAPAPNNLGAPAANRSSHEDNPAAPTPPFDYKPPAYASDAQSGGPANFDGVAGGRDNPRDPRAEGEVPGQYQKELAEFRSALEASVAETAELKDIILSADQDKLKAFAEKLKAKG